MFRTPKRFVPRTSNKSNIVRRHQANRSFANSSIPSSRSTRNETLANHEAPRWHSIFRRSVLAASVFFMMVGIPSLTALALHKTAHPNIQAWLHTADAAVEVSVYQLATGHVQMIPLNNYILSVLAAEFKPDTPMDALKAGAVACRTYVIHAKSASASGANKTAAAEHGADVTDSPAVDLPMFSTQQIQSQYGSESATFIARLEQAIEGTDGLILTYQSKPILAFTFAVSSGRTRDARDVFASDIPYLKSVDCPDDVHAPDYKSTQTFTAEEVAAALQLKSVSLANLKITAKDQYGFVKAVTLGQNVWTGANFASRLQLPSQNFSFTINNGTIKNATTNNGPAKNEQLVVTTLGRGTDIGMSLYEASSMAAKGKSWTDILATFYPGTTRQLDVDFISQS